ncbi:MAG: hypothetical protein Kow0092_10510 [Deferrisomatales bacterium]
MDKRDEPIAKILMKENESFRREMEAHQRYEKILQEFNRRPHLTPDEEMERRKVQKLKLVGKDKMVRMIEAYRKAHPEVGGGEA